MHFVQDEETVGLETLSFLVVWHSLAVLDLRTDKKISFAGMSDFRDTTTERVLRQQAAKTYPDKTWC